MENITGKKLLAAAINQIIEHPETWNQQEWHCGTKHCLGGWCQILGGKEQNSGNVRVDMENLLLISKEESGWLCSPFRNFNEIYDFANIYCTGNRDGYDSAGYNRYGYNRAGYNRDGYNRDGYNRDGYNRDGYNRDGYDSSGYNRAGCNRDGYNRAGYNRDGYNRDGYNRAGKRRQLIIVE